LEKGNIKGDETMATNRERFLKIARFESKGELFLPSNWQWFWRGTLERWEKEGLPTDVHLAEYFGFQRTEMVPIRNGLIPPFELQILEEDATQEVIIDRDGAKKRILKENRERSMDQWLEYPVKDRKSWQEYKKRLNPHSPIRYPLWWEEKKEQYQQRDYPLGIHAGSFFGQIRNWIGIENLSYLTVDNPALIEEIEEYVEYLVIETIKPALQDIKIDFALFWEDMAYKTGSLVSLDFVRKYMLPHYKKVTELLRSHGVDIITLDSDGNIEELIPLWLETGINCVYPNEVAAGMDVVALRKKYGQDLILEGGIDKRALAKGKKEIEEEVNKKVPYLLSTGGYFPGIDHSVPHDVPFENYKYYLELVKKLGT